jgi:DNA-directed RNA polymerase specialized sigma24 family protein
MSNDPKHDHHDQGEILAVFYDAKGAARRELRGVAAAILRPGSTRGNGVCFRDEHVTDVIQDAYLAVVTASSRGRLIHDLPGYAIGVVRFKAYDLLRACGRCDGPAGGLRSLHAPLGGDSGGAALIDLLGEEARLHGTSEPDPWEQAASRDALERLLRYARGALSHRTLTLQAFDILVACVGDAAWALTEIQTATGCGRSAAKMRLQEARGVVRRGWDPDDGHPRHG